MHHMILQTRELTHRYATDQEDEEDDNGVFSAFSPCKVDNEDDQHSSKR